MKTVRVRKHIRHGPEWCSCSGHKLEDEIFFDYNECTCGIKGHHFHCKVCGKVNRQDIIFYD